MKGSGSKYRHDKDYNPSAAVHEKATGAVHTDAWVEISWNTRVVHCTASNAKALLTVYQTRRTSCACRRVCSCIDPRQAVNHRSCQALSTNRSTHQPSSPLCGLPLSLLDLLLQRY